MFLQAKNMPKISGTYRICSKETGKFYIGSTKNIRRRVRNHLSRLRRGAHCNPHLQNHFIKYGEQDLFFEIVDVCDKEEAILREQSILNEWRERDWSNLFNIAIDATSPSKDRKLGADFSAKVSRGVKENWKKADFRCKMKKIHKERCSTDEYREHFSRTMKNYFSNPDNLEEFSKSQKQRYLEDPNHPFKNQEFDENRRKKMSIASSDLSVEEVCIIRSLYALKKYTQKEIGEFFNISAPSVSRIVNNKTFKFVEETI